MTETNNKYNLEKRTINFSQEIILLVKSIKKDNLKLNYLTFI